MFDSGVGGLSVLRAVRARLPAVPIDYVGDAAHAPYGGRSLEAVQARSERIAAHLIDAGAALLVVACNTATVLAIGRLRQRWPDLPFVGVEPGVRPGVLRSRSGRIGVMATEATVRSVRLQQLIERHAAERHVHLQPCPGLADAIERGPLDGPALRATLKPHCDALRAARVDTVVLGCTHYAFVAGLIGELLGPDVQLVDTADAVADRVAALWPGSAAPTDAAPLRIASTGESSPLQRLLARWPGWADLQVAPLLI